MKQQEKSGDADPFREIIETSGNSFHARVASLFREAGWEVLVSPYYVDNATDRAREVDLLCERLWIAEQHWNTVPPKLFRIQLVVECKYIPSSSATVFWFDTPKVDGVRDLIVGPIPFVKENVAISAHHYYSAAPLGVAKLFQTRTGDKLSAEEREPLYMAVNQCVGALVGLGNLEPLTRPPPHRRYGEAYLVRYPVIACSSFERFRRTTIAGGDPQPIVDNFFMELNYAWRNSARASVRQFALVDVVSCDLLGQFLDALNREGEAVQRLLVTP